MFKKTTGENWLIVGLGNPGREYEKTRHNAGFRALDILADQMGVKVDKLKYQGLYTQANYNGGKVFLLKPQTYMNLSGRSVLQLSAYFNVPPQRIIVMFDDISDSISSQAFICPSVKLNDKFFKTILTI